MSKSRISFLVFTACALSIVPILSARAAAPTIPASLVATSTSPTTVFLSWGASTDDDALAGYRVYRDGATTSVATIASNTLSYLDQGLAVASAHTYVVTAYDLANNESGQSSSTAITTLADVNTPSVPTNLSATPISNSQINLSWTASTDNVAVVGYKIFRESVQVATTSLTTYQDTGLSASTTYAYTVSAYDASGNVSGLTGAVSGTTTLTDLNAPTAPTNLTGTSISNTQINLSWTASIDNVAVTGYKIFRGSVQIATTTSTNYQNTGLTASTTYTYNVSAFDAVGNVSGLSNSITATTKVKPVNRIKPEIKIVGNENWGRTINLKSNAKIKAIVYGSSTFNPKDIVLSSVTLAGAPAISNWKSFYNNDRKLDRVFEFRAKQMSDLTLLNASGTLPITFKGVTTDGKQISFVVNVKVKNHQAWKNDRIKENKLWQAQKKAEEAKKKAAEVRKKAEELKKKAIEAQKKVTLKAKEMIKDEKNKIVVAKKEIKEIRNESRKSDKK